MVQSVPNRLSAEEIIHHPAFKATEWLLEPTKSGYCEVAKGRKGGPFNIWYEVHGVGEVKLVWIMGLAAYRTSWKRQTKYFGHTHGDKYSSLVFDNRGIAKSDKPSTRYTTSEMALDTVDLLKHLGWLDMSKPRRDLNITGVSMGGMVAQELGLLIPDHVQSLNIVSSAPRLVRTIPFIENLRQRINMFIPRSLDVQLEDIARRMFSDEFLARPDDEGPTPEQTYPTLRERWASTEIAKRNDAQGFTRKGFILQAIAAGWHFKSPAQLKELGDKIGRERISVMHGTKDNMITFHHYGLFETDLGPGPTYWVADGMGHVLFWEKEKEFNKFIEDMVTKTR